MIIKIKQNTLIGLIVGFLLVGGVIFTIIANPGQKNTSSAQSDLSTDSNLSFAREATDSQLGQLGAVQVETMVKQLGRSEPRTVFTIYFNTHSVELDFDFTQIISLKDDLGNTYQASEWTGNRGWHHVAGDIIFPALNKTAKSVVLTISAIENTSQSFSWDVDK